MAPPRPPVAIPRESLPRAAPTHDRKETATQLDTWK